jgi:hypothetical protein
LIEHWSAGRAKWLWKLRELHAVPSAPEVLFGSELLMAKVIDSNGNVVVSQASYTKTNFEISLTIM